MKRWIKTLDFRNPEVAVEEFKYIRVRLFILNEDKIKIENQEIILQLNEVNKSSNSYQLVWDDKEENDKLEIFKRKLRNLFQNKPDTKAMLQQIHINEEIDLEQFRFGEMNCELHNKQFYSNELREFILVLKLFNTPEERDLLDEQIQKLDYGEFWNVGLEL